MMKCISLELRGLGDHSKFFSFKSFLLEKGPIMVLVQETMPTADHSYAYLHTMFPKWHLVVVDVVVLFGGKAVMWDLDAAKFFACIFFFWLHSWTEVPDTCY